jgi:hypothetical protein
MFYTIYKITNQVDGKIYIGSHKTSKLDDNYMGSGKYLKRAIAKYGIDKFTKEILFVFDNPDDMYAKEAELVNEDFLATENTYNLKVGGFGGWDYINANGLSGFSDPLVAKRGREAANKVLEDKYGPNWRKLILEKANAPIVRERAKETARQTRAKNGTVSHTKQLVSLEAIAKKKETFKKNGHQSGTKNSQYGKMWITNGSESKSVHKDSPIPDGWYKGRKITK